MSSRNDGGFGDAAAEGIVGLSVAVLGAILVASLTIIVMILTELWTIYEEHGRPGQRYARLLYWALAGLAAVLLVALMLGSAGAYLAAWGFLGYVIFVEVVAARARHAQPQAASDDLSLDDVLKPWSPESTHANGRYAGNRAG